MYFIQNNNFDELRAFLTSKKENDVRRCATILGITKSFVDKDGYQQWKKKKTLIEEIVREAETSNNSLLPDWMSRGLRGRSIYKSNSANLQLQSVTELQAESKRLGVRSTHKSKAELIKLINERRAQPDEKEEKEEKYPIEVSTYDPIVKKFPRLHRVDVYLSHVPFNYDVLAPIFDWAFRRDLESLTNEEIPEHYRVVMTLSGTLKVSSYYKENGLIIKLGKVLL